MKKKRIIPVLMLREGWLVQSYKFNDYKKLGNPKHSVKRLSEWDADELIYLDISPQRHYSQSRRDVNTETYTDFISLVEDISRVARMPITVGGGIWSLGDIESRLKAGADKVCINSSALKNPKFIYEAVREFGAQCVVVSVDYWSDGQRESIYSHLKRKKLDLGLLEWVREVEYQGAGEIFLNDVLRDGQQSGYNLDSIARVCELVSCPVIACGGAGSWDDMIQLLDKTSVDAVAAGNIFHFTDQSMFLARKAIFDAGKPVRPPTLSTTP